MTPPPPCSFCGAPDATLVGGQPVCDECYIARGSCCAEWFDEETTGVAETAINASGQSPGACKNER